MHDKFAKRLADIYVHKLVKKGEDEAKIWATQILKTREDTTQVAKVAGEILKKKGYHVEE